MGISSASSLAQISVQLGTTLLHGWPGSWLEFGGVLELLAEKYTTETLPYHVVVPSIPGYGLSTRGEEDTRELTMEGASEALNSLMVALGFDAYVAQGGDVGSFLSQTMCGLFDECKAFHLADIPLSADEEKSMELVTAWATTGSAYAFEHGTRPSTVSLALNTNHLGMLACSSNGATIGMTPCPSTPSSPWYYWFTESYGRALWAYRALARVIGGPLPPMPMSKTKPFGFSATVPLPWAEFLFPNLVFYGPHERGGHFAALQEPEAFLSDIEQFLAIVGSTVVPS
ncbi:Alpha/Beta hydrolase protein [Cercophora newfieldiana]|uniref:Alpha/Beta hydrolase protein n=1 Tax=Cercophora newfieldiana TaxID=92897 RepID=A0AA39YDL7_9PEZI|nr:Alpha/Beta hydrolase protein [Cercophora newfieldiana]